MDLKMKFLYKLLNVVEFPDFKCFSCGDAGREEKLDFHFQML